MTLDQIGEIRDNIDDALIEQDSKSIDKFNECKPFIDSALDFVNVCSYLDEQEELDAKLLEKFDISKKKVSESVDEMKDFLAEIDSPHIRVGSNFVRCAFKQSLTLEKDGGTIYDIQRFANPVIRNQNPDTALLEIKHKL